MDLKRRLAVLLLLLFFPAVAAAQKPGRKPTTHRIKPGPKAEEEVLRVLNDRVKPGDTIEFAPGTFAFTRELTLRTNKVTIRGQGMAKTILSFKGQDQGKQGILVNRDAFVIADLTVEDTKGDGIKVEGASNVTFRRVRVRWSGKSKASNGAYGIYPVLCKGVLVEGCEAYGASDAGIYVGQSQQIIVRHCRAERNVAGIEIENSTDADVHDNVATNNAGGLLIFDLPDLPVKNGKRVRAFRNKVVNNNHPNFATPGTMVATISPGTGLVVMATDAVEVFKNEIKGNNTFNLAVVSYLLMGRPYKDKEYDPVPEGVWVHDNTFADGGKKPAGERGEMFAGLLGTPIPDMIWDGVVRADRKPGPGQRVVFRNNGSATFANLNWGLLGPRLDGAKSRAEGVKAILAHRPKVDRDLKPYTGELKPLPEVKLSGAK
jgi:parallel beta-helix repeat protein